ncbi:hypothetical protein AKJ09_02997 [Labilithrix luteola]|uniref:PEGA domain-containing protein n=1 Tax=Labilithrix luteola TaxID=1391654 RepID=A0A0K1PS27_9BACT|nr:hypothetical protein [Labilithrix luteola]AKU96333.1 hypothetical protein AKJ09_02997 [Labilithrix luteola]
MTVRGVLGGLVASSLFSLAAPAAADETPNETPNVTIEAAPEQPPPPRVQAQAAMAGAVRVHFRTVRPKDHADLYEVRGVQAVYVCSSPCDAAVPIGSTMRVVFAGNTEEPHDFVMTAEDGGDVDLAVRSPSKGAVAGGAVMIAGGGVIALVGLILVAVSADTRSRTHVDLTTSGLVCLLGGGGLTVGGIVLIANRSREPRLEHEPRGIRDRASTFQSDTLVAKARDPLTPAAPATPLGFSFAF